MNSCCNIFVSYVYSELLSSQDRTVFIQHHVYNVLWFHNFLFLVSLISRQGSYKLIESDEQWKLIQEQRTVSHHRSGHHRSASAHSRKGDVSQSHQKSTSPTAHSTAGMIMSEGGGNVGNRKSGYVNSGAETETEMASVSSMKRTRRRR